MTRAVAAWPALLVGGLAAVSGAVIASAPLPVLLDRFVPDDAFYYFQTARHYAATGVSTFDGLHVTSGYQPLWFGVCVAVFTAWPGGGEWPLRLLIVLQAAMSIATAVVFYRTVAAISDARWAVAAAAAWLAVFHRATMNGLETSLHCLVFVWLLHLCLPAIRGAEWTASRGAALTMGVASAALVLTRVDGLAIVVPMALWWAARSRHHAPRAWIAYVVPVSVAAAGYVGWNLIATGDIVPISGTVKSFHSAGLRAAASDGGSVLPSIAVNLLWPFELRRIWAGAALVLSAALLVLAFRAPGESALRRLGGLWPFAAGVWATYVFYGVQFFGPFSRTVWYYGPLMLVGSLAGGVIARHWVDRLSSPGAAMRWGRVAMAAAVLASSVQIVRVWRDTHQPPAGWNYHLYAGAGWARDALPPGAVIWSSSAGILGYFSGRPVVNTDGLANDRAFLEGVLRQGPAALATYTRRWDYGIDAFVSPDPAGRFPEGCPVPLPPEQVPPPFTEGGRTRQLAVYQMRASGLVACRDPR